VRLLIVSFAPLSTQVGAGQTALLLTAALRVRGHDAQTWAPPLPPPSLSWWYQTEWRRRELERFLAHQELFDWVDLPPLALDRGIARRARTIARSVQPDALYFRADWTAGTLLRGNPLRTALGLIDQLAQLRAVRRGHLLADRILCLGSAERDALARHLRRKEIFAYRIAPAAEEQRTFAAIRGARTLGSPAAVRFLWIGRWAAHKGTTRLAAFLDRRLRESPDDSCTIAGCGPEAERALPKDLLERGRIRVVPSFSRAGLFEMLADHDAGLFTSVAEGWGVTLNEMLESGMPIYATRAGGVVDLLPYFPHALRPFPPPPGPLDLDALDDPRATGYYDRFIWDRIAESYEREVLYEHGERAAR
jgi:glycosyltransferase involved in cell wall biosynthesis